MNILEIWEKHSDEEFLKFGRVQNKLSDKADVHAFILLDRLFPENYRAIVAAAEHDEIFLAPSIEELERVASEEQVIELIRCGVRIDKGTDSLVMFV